MADKDMGIWERFVRNQMANMDTATAESKLMYDEVPGSRARPNSDPRWKPSERFGSLADGGRMNMDPAKLAEFQQARDSTLAEMRKTPESERYPVMSALADLPNSPVGQAVGGAVSGIKNAAGAAGASISDALGRMNAPDSKLAEHIAQQKAAGVNPEDQPYLMKSLMGMFKGKNDPMAAIGGMQR